MKMLMCGSAGLGDEFMGSFDLSFEGLVELCALSTKEEEVFMLGVVKHLDSVALKDVLQLVVLQNIIGLPALLINESEAVNGVDLDALGDIEALLEDVLADVLALVVGVEVVEVDELVGLVVGESQDLVVGEVVGKTEAVEQHEIDVLGGLLGVLEGVVEEGADRGIGESLEQVVEQLVERAEEVGMLAEQQVQVLLELNPLLGLYTRVEQHLK